MGDKRQKGEIEMGNKEPVRFKERKFVILIERESTVWRDMAGRKWSSRMGK